ncbi:hypothetical protein E4U35_003146 [Claviceps purpurea]|nr:hypothetical protein E4U35_003146 [Claviceps purpurea]
MEAHTNPVMQPGLRQPNFAAAADFVRGISDEMEKCRNLPAVQDGAQWTELSVRMGAFEEKINKLETKVQHLDTKVEHLDTKIQNLDAKIQYLDTNIRNLESKMDSRMVNLEEKVDLMMAKLESL